MHTLVRRRNLQRLLKDLARENDRRGGIIIICYYIIVCREQNKTFVTIVLLLLRRTPTQKPKVYKPCVVQ